MEIEMENLTVAELLEYLQQIDLSLEAVSYNAMELSTEIGALQQELSAKLTTE